MSTRFHLPSALAATFTAINAAVGAFLLVGLLSNHLPHDMQNQTGKMLGPVLVTSMGLAFVAGFALVYRKSAPLAVRQQHPYRWLLGAFAVGLVAGWIGMFLFSVRPRQWFPAGGDWDLNPLMETLLAGSLFALAAFWMVYARSWRKIAS